MRKLYLHIGTPKTGTTLLQFIFRDKSDDMQSEGIYYADFGDYARQIFGGEIPDSRGYFEKLATNAPEKCDVLISTEFLAGTSPLVGRVGIKDLAESLKKATDGLFEVKIIIYLRRIDLWLESKYMQYISGGLGMDISFKEYLKLNDIDNFDFNKVVTAYAEVFRKKNMIVRIYDKKHLPEKNSLVNQFADILTLPCLKDIDLSKYSTTQSNSGFNRTAVEIARLCMPQATKEEQKEIRRILSYASRKVPFQKNIFFTMDERRKLLELKKSSYDLIAKEYFPDLKGNLFSELEDMGEPNEKLTVEDTARTLIMAVLAPSPHEHILTMRSLLVLYKIETALKKSRLLKGCGRLIMKICGIKDKEK